MFVYCNFLVLQDTTVYSQNINKQNVNIADETLIGYSFLNRYHYTKSKNYWKDDIKFVNEFPCLLGHPVLSRIFYQYLRLKKIKHCGKINMPDALCETMFWGQKFISTGAEFNELESWLNYLLGVQILNHRFKVKYSWLFR